MHSGDLSAALRWPGRRGSVRANRITDWISLTHMPTTSVPRIARPPRLRSSPWDRRDDLGADRADPQPARLRSAGCCTRPCGAACRSLHRTVVGARQPSRGAAVAIRLDKLAVRYMATVRIAALRSPRAEVDLVTVVIL